MGCFLVTNMYSSQTQNLFTIDEKYIPLPEKLSETVNLLASSAWATQKHQSHTITQSMNV